MHSLIEQVFRKQIELHSPSKPPMPKTMAERDATLSGYMDKTWEWQSLVNLFVLNAVTTEYLHDHLLDAWVTVEYPLEFNGSARGKWGVVPAMFRHAGFVTDDAEIEQPTEPLTIYRGCTLTRIDGMSWTLDQEKARWFASRFPALYGETMAVATIEMNPDRILGIATGRNESEVIIDPRRFDWKAASIEVIEED